MSSTFNRRVDVDGIEVFYQEAGQPEAPALLLLPGFAASSSTFGELLPRLAGKYRVVAPDLPGFGRSALPNRTKFSYTLDNIATVVGRFTEEIGLSRFAIYVLDYGYPVGLRLAASHPERITSIISRVGESDAVVLGHGASLNRKFRSEPTRAVPDGPSELLKLGKKWLHTPGVRMLRQPHRTRPGWITTARTKRARAGVEPDKTCTWSLRTVLSSTRSFRASSGSTSRRLGRSGVVTVRSSFRRVRSRLRTSARMTL